MSISMMYNILLERILLVFQVQPTEYKFSCYFLIFAGGFTKSGNPVLIFQDKAGFSHVSEGDLHLLLKYFISVVPRPERAEQVIVFPEPALFKGNKYLVLNTVT